MKKKIFTLMLTLTLIVSATACGAQPSPDASSNQANSTNEINNNQNNKTPTTDSSTTESEISPEPGTFEYLEENVMKSVKDSVSSLTREMDTLVAEINSFDKYVENVDRIEAFYSKICSDSLLLEISLMEHAVTYAEFIVNSDENFDDKYDNLDELYDVVYDDAGDEFYDGFYDGILEDMYDVFYDELLDDAYDNVPYDKWYDARSNEYDWWLDARSDIYEIWLDTRSDIYEFWIDLRIATFAKDADEITEVIADFKEDINALKADLQQYE